MAVFRRHVFSEPVTNKNEDRRTHSALSATTHSVTEGQTDRQADDIMVPIAV